MLTNWTDRLGARRGLALGLFASSLAVFLLSFVNLPYLDERADAYFRQSIKTALITYGTLRTVNAAISFVQESEVSASPAGVGLSIAAGQVLDPVNDVVERASNLMETSIMAIGALKILLELAELLAFRAIAGLLLLAAALHCLSPRQSLTAMVAKLCLVLLLVRLALPVAALANVFLDKAYFDGRIEKHQSNLQPFGPEADHPFAAGGLTTEKDFLDKLQEVLNPAVYLHKLKSSYTQVKENAGHIVENTVQLSILYLGKLLFQVLLLPILVFWLLLRTSDALLAANMSGRYAGKVSRTFQQQSSEGDEADRPGSRKE